MRKVKGAYTEENITKAIILVLVKIGVISRLGFFIGDNAGNNDTCWRAICRKLRFNIKTFNNRRVRCLDHILNLAAKAFLFKKNADAFEENTNQKRSNAYIEKLRELWRKKGPIGKFHNMYDYDGASYGGDSQGIVFGSGR
jgi:hypothetical protein